MEHQNAFEAIKALVVSRECLTMIDHTNPGDNKIFVTCDASDRRTGAVLSWGPTWETARPVAFDSMQLRDAQKNYPVHEKEMLVIVRAVKKWQSDLLGSQFIVYTDHRTLENFDTQKDLSQ
jgi:YD repeat-containing protein